MKRSLRWVSWGALAGALAACALLALSGCSRQPAQGGGASAAGAPVIGVENFLADFARQVAGGRIEVRSLIPNGVEPHGYEPTPQDIAAVAGARMLIVNGGGLESFLSKLLSNAAVNRPVVEASAGLVSRTAREGEVLEGGVIATGPSSEPDPHFWLDPVMAERYVANIRDGFIKIDPSGEKTYNANAEAYIAQLRELDKWIAAECAGLPPAERKLVTNHESLGYFADRYGFRIIGTLIPSVSTEASPTAQQIARLIDGLRAAGAKAVFLETGANPQLARQVAQEAGIKVVTELFTHSLTNASGPAPDYMSMMRYDVKTILTALGGSVK
ncbi:MAG: metal ABC transporter substrate-binding protein [Spirochaetia bacterium]